MRSLKTVNRIIQKGSFIYSGILDFINFTPLYTMQPDQLILKRTNNSNPDFKYLVTHLDALLTEVNGDEDAFFAPKNILDPINTAIVAYYNGKPVGCGCFKKFDENSVEIKRMYVDPEVRGKGIASAVLSELENWAKEIGFTTMVLESASKLTNAHALYYKKGYQRIPNFGNYAGIESCLCMKKELS